MVSPEPTAGGVEGYFRNGTSATDDEADQRDRRPSTGRAAAGRAGRGCRPRRARPGRRGRRRRRASGEQAPGALVVPGDHDVARRRGSGHRPPRRGSASSSARRRPTPASSRAMAVSTWGSPTTLATRKVARPASRPASRPRTRKARAFMECSVQGSRVAGRAKPPTARRGTDQRSSVAGVAQQVPRVVDPLVDRGAGRDRTAPWSALTKKMTSIAEQSEEERPRGELAERDDGKGGAPATGAADDCDMCPPQGCVRPWLMGWIGHAGLTSPLINGAEAMSQ